MSLTEQRIKIEVRQFYDQIGWQIDSDGFYQNAHYEDLRPVAREYIHRCHLRVNQHLNDSGQFLLDAGSGPIQWPEYLTYSQGYQYRVCVDLSIEGLREARKRVGEHGLFVVADVTSLPFAQDVFDGIVSLHTIHHVPAEQKREAYLEMYRSLRPGCSAVTVNGWARSIIVERMMWLVRLAERLIFADWRKVFFFWKKSDRTLQNENATERETDNDSAAEEQKITGTFTTRDTPESFCANYANLFEYEVFVWRSVSVRMLRALIHRYLLGKLLLRVLYWLENRFPRWFGDNGQYPLIVVYK